MLDGRRVAALAYLAEIRTKAGDDAAADIFARALSIARALPDRGYSLRIVAQAQAGAGLHDDAAHTFAEAVGAAAPGGPLIMTDAQAQAGLRDDAARTLAGVVDAALGGTLIMIAEAQRDAGFITEAAAIFDDALAATLSGDERLKELRLVMLIHRIGKSPHGQALVATSPALRLRLLKAAQALPDRMNRASALSDIARMLPE
jgi:hypothetical protein